MLPSSECRINNQTVLYENIDENYEVTSEEIREYALFIGIDPDKVNLHALRPNNQYFVSNLGVSFTLAG